MSHADAMLESWGRRRPHGASLLPLFHQPEQLPGSRSLTPRGLGRSYGDSCFGHDSLHLDGTGMGRILAWNDESGLITCEAGMSLDDLLRFCVPRGWFLPVTPGTKFVTLAGAVANDIHGKNHHRAGTFGCHVESFTLLRSDCGRVTCGPDSKPEWFAATIGGLGLTGLITEVRLRLKKIETAWIRNDTVKLRSLAHFFELADEDAQFEYTVAWIDTFAKGSQLGRGLYFRGDHAARENLPGIALCTHRDPQASVPCSAPGWFLNAPLGRAFNLTYRTMNRAGTRTVHYDPFFYPLDKVGAWNRLYGRAGFFQHQCVLPLDHAKSGCQRLLQTIADSGHPAFLAVLKLFGSRTSPGLLSFPREGATLAVDFPDRGAGTRKLLALLDRVVEDCGGRLYPAKDACMSRTLFHQGYGDAVTAFSRHIDPRFTSAFWQRMEEPKA